MLSAPITKRLAERLAAFLNTNITAAKQRAAENLMLRWWEEDAVVPRWLSRHGDEEAFYSSVEHLRPRRSSPKHYRALQRDARRVLTIESERQRRIATKEFYDAWRSADPVQWFDQFTDALALSRPLFPSVEDAVALTLGALAGRKAPAEVYKCLVCDRFLFHAGRGRPNKYCSRRCKKRHYKELSHK